MIRNNQTLFSIAASLLLLAGVSFAADSKAAGERLFQSARQASDIRTDGAPPFRIEGSIRIIPKAPGQETTGRYTEIWHSQTKWRSEVETSSFHRVEIGGVGRKWRVDTGTDRPDTAFSGDLTLLFSRIDPKITGTSERKVGDTPATCVKLKTEWSKDLACFDPQTGFFLLQEDATTRSKDPHRSCVYRNYEKFADRWFPRLIRCTTARGDDIELTVSKLAAEFSVDESLFVKPPGAIETANCLGRAIRPEATYSPDPKYPDHHKEDSTVVLWTIVGLDGKPEGLRIARSGGEDFDQPALDIVRQWKFKPSTCDGVPVPVEINIEITFRKY
jgi:TonB family protein